MLLTIILNGDKSVPSANFLPPLDLNDKFYCMSALWFILKHKTQYQTLIRVMNYFILVIILLRYMKVLMKSTTSLIILIKKILNYTRRMRKLLWWRLPMRIVLISSKTSLNLTTYKLQFSLQEANVILYKLCDENSIVNCKTKCLAFEFLFDNYLM